MPLRITAPAETDGPHDAATTDTGTTDTGDDAPATPGPRRAPVAEAVSDVAGAAGGLVGR
jgi:hypothetical protein